MTITNIIIIVVVVLVIIGVILGLVYARRRRMGWGARAYNATVGRVFGHRRT